MKERHLYVSDARLRVVPLPPFSRYEVSILKSDLPRLWRFVDLGKRKQSPLDESAVFNDVETSQNRGNREICFSQGKNRLHQIKIGRKPKTGRRPLLSWWRARVHAILSVGGSAGRAWSFRADQKPRSKVGWRLSDEISSKLTIFVTPSLSQVCEFCMRLWCLCWFEASFFWLCLSLEWRYSGPPGFNISRSLSFLHGVSRSTSLKWGYYRVLLSELCWMSSFLLPLRVLWASHMLYHQPERGDSDVQLLCQSQTTPLRPRNMDWCTSPYTSAGLLSDQSQLSRKAIACRQSRTKQWRLYDCQYLPTETYKQQRETSRCSLHSWRSVQ